MFEGLDEVDWATLGLGETFHGTSIPEALRGFLNETEYDLWYTGDYWTVENLLNSLWDESGKLQPGTPLVYRYLLEVLTQTQIVTRVDVVRCLFVWFDDRGGEGEIADQVRAVLRLGLPIYQVLLQEGNPELKAQVQELLSQKLFQG